MNESKAQRVAANGRPLGRGGVTRDKCFSPSTRVGCSRTGPGLDPCFRFGCGGDEATDTKLRLKPDNAIEMSADTARCRVYPLLTAAFQQPPAFASLSCDSCGPKFGPSPRQKLAICGDARQIASVAE
jgi:hypothetical protein